MSKAAAKVTYLGKPGWPDTEGMPVQEIPDVFYPGKPIIFSAAYLARMGLYGDAGKSFVETLVSRMNQNRPKDKPLLSLEWVEDAGDDAPKGETSQSTGSAGTEESSDILVPVHVAGINATDAQLAEAQAAEESPSEKAGDESSSPGGAPKPRSRSKS